jgi:D-alanyl-lipoteichoic acid acyltransferase DltB (MBOAT superfamily)
MALPETDAVSPTSLSWLLVLALVWPAVRVTSSAAARRALLLACSLALYSLWGLPFLFALLASGLFNHAWCGMVRRRRTPSVLWAGLAVNLAWILGWKLAGALDGIAAPIGLSFWTFQAMGALVDVYRERDPEAGPVEFLLFLSFWPAVLSGPIGRASEVVPQLRVDARPGWDDVTEGCRRILIGLFLKVVLAETLARGLDAGEGVNFGFDRMTGGWGALDVLFLAAGFGFQLYFDFAGYSNIALGSARLLGVRLRENFDDPYLAGDPSRFWNRWHMSLSSWIRDYVFFPLAALRPGARWARTALVLSMVLFGLWHGIGLNFLLWGLFHGMLLALHRLLPARRAVSGVSGEAPGPIRFLGWAGTFSCVMLAWILFRAPSAAQAGSMYATLLEPAAWSRLSLRPNFYLAVLAAGCGYFLVAGLRAIPAARAPRWLPLRAALAPVGYAALILAVLAWSVQGSTFVYFQF